MNGCTVGLLIANDEGGGRAGTLISADRTLMRVGEVGIQVKGLTWVVLAGVALGGCLLLQVRRGASC